MDHGPGADSCSGATLARVPGLKICRRVINFFMDGPDLVRWELTQADSSGACRLSVHHAHGVSVEYFATAAMALRRVQELESLLASARGMSLAHTRLAS
jgi:hypothetical protein